MPGKFHLASCDAVRNVCWQPGPVTTAVCLLSSTISLLPPSKHFLCAEQQLDPGQGGEGETKYETHYTLLHLRLKYIILRALYCTLYQCAYH